MLTSMVAAEAQMFGLLKDMPRRPKGQRGLIAIEYR